MQSKTLPPGFEPIEKAVEIIKSDTRENPVVDMDLLVKKIQWLQANNNFRIPKIRRLKPEEVYRTKRGKIVEYETIGEINVMVETVYEKELLRKTILDKYRELTHKEYKGDGVRAMSTVADDAHGKDAVRPRANKPLAQAGSSIGGGTETISNGDFAV